MKGYDEYVDECMSHLTTTVKWCIDGFEVH